jgi:sugar phosphate permease
MINEMEKFWIKALTVTGSVGVIAFLISEFMKHFFKKEIIDLLGSDRIFYIVISLISLFAIALIIAILKHQKHGVPQTSTSTPPSKNSNVSYNKSNHNGNNNF